MVAEREIPKWGDGGNRVSDTKLKFRSLSAPLGGKVELFAILSLVLQVAIETRSFLLLMGDADGGNRAIARLLSQTSLVNSFFQAGKQTPLLSQATNP